ncbi:hypothetical protein FNV43_RR00903 [Rhamnella rubrinervis]|uniref:Uncharacterized protein n=1 Tax=Rhamnella rubrinervis TaxID=2594499 RepID=A0A8K0HRI2_9ROSA|nr:hypothetical protein FNV43_RR00903 [Rhamnella rubrinervis]
MFEEICKILDLRRVISGYDPESICDQCRCSRSSRDEADNEFDREDEECSTSAEEVCGSVGAVKSSLLYAILGEIPKISGTVDVFGSIAYVSQNAWIQSGTVRDNILYGKPMDTKKYENAINACALDKD